MGCRNVAYKKHKVSRRFFVNKEEIQNDKCVNANCAAPFFRLFDGKPYCKQHYQERSMADLLSAYDEWQVGAEPSKRFRYMLGRFYDEFASCRGESYLSPARVRDRGFEFVKTDLGCSFSITRHLNAWSADRPVRFVVELWEANLAKKEFVKVGERDWEQGDPD